MGKQSRRENRKNRAPAELRYSKSGATTVEIFDDGTKAIHLGERVGTDLGEYLAWAKLDFPQRFGREMRGDDPLFYDLEATTPQPMDVDQFARDLDEAMEKVGVAPELRHAVKVTGRMVSEENVSLLSPQELAEWDAAIDEYLFDHPEA